jgi:hypothetical protein
MHKKLFLHVWEISVKLKITSMSCFLEEAITREGMVGAATLVSQWKYVDTPKKLGIP